MTNFVGTLVVDGVVVLLAASGYLSPLVAAFIHVSSELIFHHEFGTVILKTKY